MLQYNKCKEMQRTQIYEWIFTDQSFGDAGLGLGDEMKNYEQKLRYGAVVNNKLDIKV